jgi:5-hydroxyisourate hydrolase
MITTHVLDTARGRPAAGVPVLLEKRVGAAQWESVGSGETDPDGRLRTLTHDAAALPAGVYRLVFDTSRYFKAHGASAFYPEVVVVFETGHGESHYHVPLLVSPFGYTTYRGT